jgi:DNA modification methylase
LRDYGHDGQIGLEATPEAYVDRMVEVFGEVRRVLRDDGTCWVNLGDSYAGSGALAGGDEKHGGDAGCRAGWTSSGYKRHNPPSNLKPKDLVGIPWRVALALQADGWWLRQDIIWHKPNPMPESVRDRCTKAHEYVFLLTKSERYFYDAEAVSEAAKDPSGHKYERGTYRAMRHAAALEGTAFDGPTRSHIGNTRVNGKCVKYAAGHGANKNRRSVWTVTTKPYKGAHFATMPPDLVEPCILAGTSEEGCCPHCGSSWTRVTERKKLTRPRPNDYTKRQGDEGTGNACANSVAGVSVETKGWRPTCKCPEHRPVPCLVLDPFAGSGTTLAVAARLGRSGIGCELNPEYIVLAEKRIAEAREKVGLFA